MRRDRRGGNGFVSGRYLKRDGSRKDGRAPTKPARGASSSISRNSPSGRTSRASRPWLRPSIVKAPDAKPVFGVIGLKGETSYDEDAGRS